MRRTAHCSHLVGLVAVLAISGAGGVRAQAPARRIVSLSPASTELLFALGAGDRVVGRTTWCDYPPEARAAPSVGDGLNPNLEAIVALQPDLVVLYRSPLNETAAQRLGALGITAVVLPQDRLEELARAARTLGRLTGHGAAGDSIAAYLDTLLAAPVPDLGLTVAFVVWDTPLIVIGGESYLDQLTALAGAHNVFHDLRAASTVVSLETLAVRDPDVIVTLVDSLPAPAPPSFTQRREWRAVRAVRSGRFVVLARSLFGRPSPRAALAAAELRKLLLGARAR